MLHICSLYRMLSVILFDHVYGNLHNLFTVRSDTSDSQSYVCINRSESEFFSEIYNVRKINIKLLLQWVLIPGNPYK